MLLLEEIGGHESPLLPSLRQLDLIDGNALIKRRTLRLCDALKKRVEQGVPLKVLDLRACFASVDAVRLLRTFVADIRGPKASTSWKDEEPPAWARVDDSDKENEGFNDNYEEEEEGEEEDEG